MTPASALEERREAATDSGEHHEAGKEVVHWFEWRKFLTYSGPGVLMCIAYLDPGNLEADLQQGSYTNFTLLWVMLLAHGGGFLLQVLAARLGNVTGRNLAQICCSRFSRPVSLFLYAMAEIAIIGADVQEVLGSAMAFQILLGVPMWLGCLFTGLDSFVFLSVDYFGARKLEILVAMLVGTMTVCFWINFARALPAAGTLANGLIPRIHEHAVRPAIGTIGAIIMPHNIYLHSALVQFIGIDRGRRREVEEANKYCTIDAALALVICFFVNLAVMGCFAQHFFDRDCASASVASACLAPELQATNFGMYGGCLSSDGGPGVCTEIGLRSAGDAMRVSLGEPARYIWAVGLLAAGLSSTMMSTYAGQFVMEGFLALEIPGLLRMVITRCISLVPALAVAQVAAKWGPLADSIGQWLNVLQSLQLPFALVPLLFFTDSVRIMGKYRNNWAISTACWTLAACILAANGYLVSHFLSKTASGFFQHSLVLCATLVAIVAAYVGALSWVLLSVRAAEDGHGPGLETCPLADPEAATRRPSYGSVAPGGDTAAH